jgi:hypothetical protein
MLRSGRFRFIGRATFRDLNYFIYILTAFIAMKWCWETLRLLKGLLNIAGPEKNSNTECQLVN